MPGTAKTTTAAPATTAATTAATQLNALALGAGQLHSLLVHADGRLFAYGDNTYGQLGIGNEAPNSGLTPVALTERVSAVAAGAYHSLVMTVSGKILSFGRNAFGQLGTGGVSNAASPQAIANLPEAVAIAAGAYHSLVLGRDGSVWAFGDNTQGQCGPALGENIQNESGQLIARRVIRPQRILASGATAIAAGAAHSLILLANGQVLAFGANDHGQLGDGTNTNRSEMLPVSGISQAKLIAAGSDHSLVVVDEPATSITQAQTQASQTKTSDSQASQTKASVGQATRTQASTTPGERSSQQTLLAFGDNSLGQLGSGSDYAIEAQERSPVRVDWTAVAGAGFEIRKLAAGYGNSLLIVEKSAIGTVKGATPTATRTDPRIARILVWGSNAYGQLGTGDDASHDKPTLLQAVDQGYKGDTWLPFEAVAIGGGHILLASQRGLYGAVGRNSNGQLGITGSLTEPYYIGITLPPLAAGQTLALDRARAAEFGAAVQDSRDPAKFLPLQVPWDTTYAFGENSVPEPTDPRLPYLLAAGALLVLAALLGAGLWLHQRRAKKASATQTIDKQTSMTTDETVNLASEVAADKHEGKSADGMDGTVDGPTDEPANSAADEPADELANSAADEPTDEPADDQPKPPDTPSQSVK